MNNINLIVLKSLFTFKEFWLEDIEYLKEDYQILARKLLAYFMNKDAIPTEQFVLQNVTKFSDEKDVQKKLKNIMLAIMEADEITLTQEELQELLEEDYKDRQIQPLLLKAGEALKEKDFDKVKTELNKVDSVLEVGDSDLIYDDDKEFFEREDSSIVFKSTGLWKDTLLSKVPEGSMVLISSRSKTGKTSLVIKSATENFLSGKDVYIVSYEVQRASLKNRMLSYISQVPLQEINEGVYSASDNRDRVALARYCVTRDTDFNSAKKVYLEKGWEGVKALPKRTNRLIIRASYTKEDIDELRKQGKKPRPMPNDVALLKELKLLNKNKTLDYMYIDYVSLIPFADSKASREINISTFSRNFKEALLETSTIGFLLAQSKSKAEPHMPLYSQSAILDCDMALSITPTKDMIAEGLTAVSLTFARHSEGFKSYIAQPRLEVQDFELMEDEVMEFEDLLDIVKKENKDTK